MTNPRVLVNGSSTSSAVSVTAGSTVTVQLNDRSGVDSWSLTCTSTDELNAASAVNATVVVTDTVNKIATFTAPAAGSAVIFSSTVNGGVDTNGRQRADWVTSFKVYVPTSSGKQVLALGETGEAGQFGWLQPINDAIRNGTSTAASTLFANSFLHMGA